jgi:glycosyltransferase involved in cell wall biosynthesis
MADRDRVAFRRELGLVDYSRILLFAGRMVPEKNPLFALEVLAQLNQLDPTVAGVFVGAGSLDGAVRQLASELGVGGAFRHLGWRDDVARIMCCCDWFILPRPERPIEGIDLAVIEAQLAGLRMLLSRAIPVDTLLPTGKYLRLAIADGPRAWANAAIELFNLGEPSRVEARIALEQSAFAMDIALAGLISLYQ